MMLRTALTHRFPGFTLDVDFTIERPGITALFGPSGSGKTTCINAISGLLKPDRARIQINGAVVTDTERGLFVPARRRRIGYVFQDARLFPHMDVAANLDFGARRAKTPPSAAERHRYIDLLGIGHLLARRPATLSGGERQRVALGRALLSNPRLLLLDEPLAAVDAGRKAEIFPYLERLRDEARIPIVYVSHSIDEMARLANEIVLLSEGRVAAQGPVGEVMTQLDLFPLTGRFERGAVIDGHVVAHDAGTMMSEIAFDHGRIWVPQLTGSPGSAVRLRVRARDIILARTEPHAISANNIVPAVITDIRDESGPFLDVQLSCGGGTLLARITRMSRARLELAPGQKVFAIVKSVSVESHPQA